LTVKSEVEKHWLYNKRILELCGVEKEAIKLCGYLYQQAMIHGYGHGEKNEWT